MLGALYVGASVSPPSVVPAPYADAFVDTRDGLRRTGSRPAPGDGTGDRGQGLAITLSLPEASITAALLQLESEGFVLRGQFSGQSSDTTTEWCERRLLARIHRHTIRTLRAEIEPVSGADYMRFLLDWQGVTGEPRREGISGLAGAVEQLEGYEIPAAAWESEVLPARMGAYHPADLDSLCLSGHLLWARLAPGRNVAAAPVRATPIALLQRQNSSLWRGLSQSRRETGNLSASARALAEYLQAHGASFFEDLLGGAHLLRSQAETALGELVAAGLVSADSFGGLRALLTPLERKRKQAASGRQRAIHGLQQGGRWSLTGPLERAQLPAPGAVASMPGAVAPAPDQLEFIAWLLLRRYGVIFRKLLDREPDWLPPWHLLLRVYRRLEAQGQIRGGRFVASSSGEQYALPDAVTALRSARRRQKEDQLVSLSAADPLNLLGIVTPGARLAALTGNRLLLRDGLPVAVRVAGEVRFLEPVAPGDEWALRTALLRSKPKSSWRASLRA